MAVTVVRDSGWTPEQVAVIVPILLASCASAVVTVITAIKQRSTDRKVDAVHQELRPPSNGKTAGTLLENTAYALHTMASVYAKEHGMTAPPDIVQPDHLPVPDRPPDQPTL